MYVRALTGLMAYGLLIVLPALDSGIFDMKRQATPATQRQLAYLAHWGAKENGGYTFGRDDVIPESTLIKPRAWRISRRVEMAVSAALIALIFVGLYFKGAL